MIKKKLAPKSKPEVKPDLVKEVNMEQIESLIISKEAMYVELGIELEQLKTQLLELKTGFKKGDTIVDDEGCKGVVAHRDGFRWKYNKYKKDGNLSSVNSFMYRPDKCKKV